MGRKRLPDRRNKLIGQLVHGVLIEGRNLTAVASELGLQKSTASRLMKEARTIDAYSIHLHLPRDEQLELDLSRRYSVDAVVVPIATPRMRPGAKEGFTRLLGEAAAWYLEGPQTPLVSGQKVGISCGATIREIVHALTPGRFERLGLVQLTVETETGAGIDQSPFTLVSALYGKWRTGSDVYAIQPLPKTMKSGNHFSKAYEQCRKEVMDRVANLDVAILGISRGGRNGEDSFSQILHKAGVNLDVYKKLRAIGEIANRPYDTGGVDLFARVEGLDRHVDGVELEVLRDLVKKNKKVIAVAGGSQKVDAIETALRTRMVNCLVTDIGTAEELLTTGR